MRKVDFDKANRKELSASLEQKLSHCGVLGKANGPVESVRGLGCFPELLQEVGANCPVGLKSGDIVRVDPEFVMGFNVRHWESTRQFRAATCRHGNPR